LVICFEQEWKQKIACSQGDLDVYCHEKNHTDTVIIKLLTFNCDN
jgi:hypothetical protein